MDYNNKQELIKSATEALCMWNLVHMEHYGVDLECDTSYDGESYRRLKQNLEKLKGPSNED